jgi:hypothetical protein
LTSFTAYTPYVALFGRVVGLLAKDLFTDRRCFHEARLAGLYYDMGACLGNSLSLVFDTKL